jgi:carboxypeptidase PM20D1
MRFPCCAAGGTDSSNYVGLPRHGVLRFVPTLETQDDVKRVHGTNERQSVQGFTSMLCFYRRALQVFAGGGGGDRGGGLAVS